MTWLVLELNELEGAALAQAAAQTRQTPQEFIKAAIAEYLKNHAREQRPTAVEDVETTGTRPALSGGLNGNLSSEQARIQRAEAKSRMPGFGLLKGKLQVDGIPVADGVEYQNRIRDRW